MISERTSSLNLPVREAISYDFEDFRLDVKRQELQQNGIPVQLTHKAFQVLLILVQNSEQSVEKEYIYKQLWGDSFVEDANLTQHIYVLRKTLGKTSSGESFIETVARTGYRFVPKVRPVFPSAISEAFFRPRSGAEPALKIDPKPFPETQLRLAKALTESNKKTEAVTKDPGSETIERPRAVDRKRWLAAATAAGLFVIVLLIYFRPTVPVETPAKSVAVLPFKPIGDASQNDKLGLGMADSIITRLSKLQQIPVRPTSSIVRYTDIPASNSIEAGKEMGVDTVLEGTVQHEGDRVRVSVKLIEVGTGRSLWAENFDESYTNIFSVQDSISHKIVRALAINLSQQQREVLSGDATTNVEALKAYQMGFYLYSTRTKENLNRSVEYFDEAIRHDPAFAKAYAVKADAYNMLRYYGFMDRREAIAKATELANKALEINPDTTEAYIALGNIQQTEMDGRLKAKASLEKAIKLSPYNGTARLRYGWVLIAEDLNAASEQMRLATEYDPLSGITNGAYCSVLTFQHRFDEAIKVCERAVELAPETPTNRILLADAFSLAGRHSEAIAQISRRIEEASGPEKLTAKGSLADYLIRAGRNKEAEVIYEELKAALPQYPQVLNDLTIIAYALGRPDEGIAYFERAFKDRRIPVVMLAHNPIWKNVNADPRISPLIERLRMEFAERNRS